MRLTSAKWAAALAVAVCSTITHGAILFQDDFESPAWESQAGGNLPTNGQEIVDVVISLDGGLPTGTISGTVWQWIQGAGSNLSLTPELGFANGIHPRSNTPLGDPSDTTWIHLTDKRGLMLNLTALGATNSLRPISITFDWATGVDAGANSDLRYALLDGPPDPTWSNEVNIWNDFGAHALHGNSARLDTPLVATNGTAGFTNVHVTGALNDVYFVIMSDNWNNRVPVIDNVVFEIGDPDSIPPAAPIAVYGMEGVGEAHLDWHSNWDDDLASYSVFRSDTSGGPYVRIASNISASAYTDTTATNPAVYYYVVRARDTSGNDSTNSVEAAVDNTTPHDLTGRPNIIVILSDDHGFADVGYHADGSDDVVTPYIDSIAANGIMFRTGYVTASVCAPTRAALLTGRYQNRFGFEGLPSSYKLSHQVEMGIPSSELTIAELLRSLGYATGMIGKWHTGKEESLEPNACGFEEFYGVNNGASNYLIDSGNGFKINRSVNPIVRNYLRLEGVYEYLTDAFGTESAAFIDRHAHEPFFLYAAFNAIHGPMQITDEYYDMSIFNSITNEGRRVMVAMLYSMDLAIGNILDALDRNGLENDTFIIFLSDNGGATQTGQLSRNDPLRGHKTQMWEGGIRIPFCMQWPAEFTGGQTVYYPIIANDILPTVLAAAGADIPTNLDGVNLLPYLTGQTTGEPHGYLYWRRFDNWAVRDSDWKLVSQDGVTNLFNISIDISETNDLFLVETAERDRLFTAYTNWSAQMMEPQFGLATHPVYNPDWGNNPTPYPASISEWISANYWLTGSETDLLADPDGDGCDNLYEYAMATAPDSAGSRPGDLLLFQSGMPHISYSTLLGTDSTPFPLTYSVEYCDNLATGNWASATLTPVGDPVTNATLRATEQLYESAHPVGSNGFYRLDVSTP